jgi:hypothetical protein
MPRWGPLFELRTMPFLPNNDTDFVIEDFGDLGQAFAAGGRRKPR